MAEYIEKEKATDVLCDACGNAACPKGLIPRCSYYEKMQAIPAADVKSVVRGKWHDHYQMASEYFVATCSACGSSSSFTDSYLPPYCPMCGARMEENDA